MMNFKVFLSALISILVLYQSCTAYHLGGPEMICWRDGNGEFYVECPPELDTGKKLESIYLFIFRTMYRFYICVIVVCIRMGH